mmetsp:Transcript_39194/g.116592  ORF Transcript_39194/g.116592 Transcript_39194/m.116592 type:complete len:252 (+) Transcript_39194:187-942(+)
MRGGSGVIQAKTSCLPRITRVLHDAPVDCPKGCPKEFHSELCSKLLAQKKRQQWVQCIRSLVALDVAVDCPHERRGCDVPDRSARQRQPDTKHERVPEEEAGLKQARHLRLEHKVVQRKQEHVERRRRAHPKRHPLPVVVFRVQEEVGADDRHTSRHGHQNDDHQQHEAIHIVDLVPPEAGEDEVHLDEDGAKWQQPARQCDGPWLEVPLSLGDGRRDALDAARPVGQRVPVAAEDGADEAQREGDEEPQE